MTRKLNFSFEFFPPKEVDGDSLLYAAVDSLKVFAPQFISMTYGAGGSTHDRSVALAVNLYCKTQLPVAMHLTCWGVMPDEIEQLAHALWQDGIRHVVALRGDVLKNPHPDQRCQGSGAYQYAVDLVRALRMIHPFEISVAAYPETHPTAISAEADLENLKRKVDAGATRAITQFFFDNAHFLRFRDRVAHAGIDVQLVPGMMPISNFARIKQFAESCKASLPTDFCQQFLDFDQLPLQERRRISALVTLKQCLNLLENGVDTFHFYTLNRAEIVESICRQLLESPRTTRHQVYRNG